MDCVEVTPGLGNTVLPPSSVRDGLSSSHHPQRLDMAAMSSESHNNKRPHSPESSSPPSSSESGQTVTEGRNAQASTLAENHQVSTCIRSKQLSGSVPCACLNHRDHLDVESASNKAMKGAAISLSDGQIPEATFADQQESMAQEGQVPTKAGKSSVGSTHGSDRESLLSHTTLTPVEVTRMLMGGSRAGGSRSHHPSTVWNDRDLTHLAASQILNKLKCTSCLTTLVDPVTLPCGHNMCMQCVHQRTHLHRGDSHRSSSTSSLYVPPRLPLSSLTVPCGDDKCPRAAIGQGLGSWTGEVAIYGAARHGALRPTSSNGMDHAGALPIDGFIVGVPDHSFRLTVIPAQLRSESHLFAYAAEPDSGSAADSLRVDVTLSKALGVLRQALRKDLLTPFGAPAEEHSADRLRPRRDDQPRHSHRHRGRPSSRRWTRNARPAAPRIPIMGRYEEELESGTVGDVRAASDSEDDGRSTRRSGGWGGGSLFGRGDMTQPDAARSDVLDDDAASYSSDTSFSSALSSAWPDDIGGAYARAEDYRSSAPRGWHEDADQIERRSRARSKRRRRTVNYAMQGGRSTVGAGRHARASSADDEWDTEDSRPSSEKSATLPGRQQHASSSRSPAPRAENVWNQLVSRFDRGERVDIADASVRTDGESVGLKAAPSPVPDRGGEAKERSASATGNSHSPSLDSLFCDLVDVLECHVCYLLAYEPITSPCGHSLCRTCLARSLDHSDRCPLCRAQLPTFAFYQDHRPNAALTILSNCEVDLPASSDVSDASAQPSMSKWGLQSLFLERKAAVEEERRLARLSTPIFVCTLAFPGMPTILHIFEPRYRLMVRRCLESGNPRFGMVLPSNDPSSPVPGLNEYGTMLEIRSVQMLPDGRSLIETVGTHRFRLLDRGSIDGYTVGQIERFDDISPAAERALEAAALLQNQRVPQSATNSDTASTQGGGQTAQTPAAEPICAGMATAMRGSMSPPLLDNADGSTNAMASIAGVEDSAIHTPNDPVLTTQELVDVCVEFIELVKSGSAPWLMSRLNSTYGPMPEPSDVERFSYWMALVIPIDEHEKAKLLPVRSPRLRLCLVVQWINKLRQSWWFTSGCTIN